MEAAASPMLVMILITWNVRIAHDATIPVHGAVRRRRPRRVRFSVHRLGMVLELLLTANVAVVMPWRALLALAPHFRNGIGGTRLITMMRSPLSSIPMTIAISALLFLLP